MMRNFWLCFYLALLAVGRAQAAPAPKTVVIKMGDIFDVSGYREAEPLRRLTKSLKQYPKTRQFRVIWQQSAPNAGKSATALYDRRAHTLKFYSDTSIGGMGNEAISAEIQHWMFHGVTEAMLNKLERKHRGTPNGSDGASYFTELDSYGAKKRDLGSRQVLSAHGKAMRRRRNH